MTKERNVQRVLKSKPTIEGAGVHLNRVFGFGETSAFDPFLMLDDFRSDDPQKYRAGFPWHPHRGIETITYMIEGSIEHGDSMGNHGSIREGDVQWMTAGSGIIHQEMPRGSESDRMGGFQLWANLPASHKMMDPRYQEVKRSQIPEVKLTEGVTVKVICGNVNGVVGPVSDIMTDPEYLDVSIEPGKTFTRNIPSDRTVFAYCIGGKAIFGKVKDSPEVITDAAGNPAPSYGRFVENGSLVLFGAGDMVSVSTTDAPVRFLLICGKPLREPVAWYGPIVMNTQDEIRVAFLEYENGTFVKVAALGERNADSLTNEGRW